MSSHYTDRDGQECVIALSYLEPLLGHGAADDGNCNIFTFQDGAFPVASEYGVKLFRELTSRDAELSATKEKLEAAEQRIRESQEQKPEGYGYDEKRGLYPVYAMPPIQPELAEAIEQAHMAGQYRNGAGCDPSAYDAMVYRKRIIPPELEELQRENAELRKQLEAGIAQNKELWNLNAELQKKIESLNDLHH